MPLFITIPPLVHGRIATRHRMTEADYPALRAGSRAAADTDRIRNHFTLLDRTMSHAILDLFRRRYACHTFQRDRAVNQADLDVILEAGRLSPSSFGLEQWKFVVVTQAEVRTALQGACFNQRQVGNAPVVIVVLAKTADLNPDSDYIRTLMAREYPGEALEPALANYRGFYAMTDVKAWSITHCHIAAANMMTAATAVGLDSCAIGGFLPDEVKRLLEIDGERYEVALILPFGYCAEPAPEKQRLPLSELVEYR
jgi:nitroreductase